MCLSPSAGQSRDHQDTLTSVHTAAETSLMERKTRADLIAMDDVIELINYAHRDWLRGKGRGLCQSVHHRDIVE